MLPNTGRPQLLSEGGLPRVEVVVAADVADPQITQIADDPAAQQLRILIVSAAGDVDLHRDPMFDPVPQQRRCRAFRAGGVGVDRRVHLGAGDLMMSRLDVVLRRDRLAGGRLAERAALVVAVESPAQQDRGSSLRHMCHDPSVPR
jgi:hypothetical protein